MRPRPDHQAGWSEIDQGRSHIGDPLRPAPLLVDEVSSRHARGGYVGEGGQRARTGEDGDGAGNAGQAAGVDAGTRGAKPRMEAELETDG